MSGLTERIQSVADTNGIPEQEVIDALVAACKASIRKTYGQDLDVEIGFDDGHLEAYAFKAVIPDSESITNSARQIHLSAARKEDPEVTVDDEYGAPINVESLERKACEPGQLQKLFERYGGGARKALKAVKAPVSSITIPVSPPELSAGGPPTEVVVRNGRAVEVPFVDPRTPEQIVADMVREVDTWKQQMVSQFTEKIDTYAKALKELIEANVKKKRP